MNVLLNKTNHAFEQFNVSVYRCVLQAAITVCNDYTLYIGTAQYNCITGIREIPIMRKEKTFLNNLNKSKFKYQ